MNHANAQVNHATGRKWAWFCLLVTMGVSPIMSVLHYWDTPLRGPAAFMVGTTPVLLAGAMSKVASLVQVEKGFRVTLFGITVAAMAISISGQHDYLTANEVSGAIAWGFPALLDVVGLTALYVITMPTPPVGENKTHQSAENDPTGGIRQSNSATPPPPTGGRANAPHQTPPVGSERPAVEPTGGLSGGAPAIGGGTPPRVTVGTPRSDSAEVPAGREERPALESGSPASKNSQASKTSGKVTGKRKKSAGGGTSNSGAKPASSKEMLTDEQLLATLLEDYQDRPLPTANEVQKTYRVSWRKGARVLPRVDAARKGHPHIHLAVSDAADDDADGGDAAVGGVQ